MKTRLFHFLTLLVLLAGLFPATVALADGDDGNYEFKGIVVSFPAGWVGDWSVNDGFTDRVVHATDFTRIEQKHGPIAVGACVEVKGWLQDDSSVNATKIETKEAWKCGGSGGGSGGGHTEFYGTIESLPNTAGWIGDWSVSGRVVHVDNSTRIEQEHGPVAVGAYVEVKGWPQADGSINAAKIEVKMSGGGGGGGTSYIKFYGTIESLPAAGWIGDWTISGRTVHVDSLTRIEQKHGPVAVGAYVEVKGWSQADGSVNATKIEVENGPDGGGGSGGTGYTKFYGTVEQMPSGGLAGTWIVSARTVYVSNTTWIDERHGPAVVGAYVEVHGYPQADGSVNATKIEVKASPGGSSGGGTYTKFYGTVEQMPSGTFVGTWLISGRVTTVTASTRIDQEHGPAVVGAYVEVEGYLQADGSVNATKIEVKSSSGSGGGGSVGYIKFYGIIEDLPASGWIGDWMVSGRIVHVSNTTRVEQEHGLVRMGAYVEVKGIQQADGSVNATKIEVKN